MDSRLATTTVTLEMKTKNAEEHVANDKVEAQQGYY